MIIISPFFKIIKNIIEFILLWSRFPEFYHFHYKFTSNIKIFTFKILVLESLKKKIHLKYSVTLKIYSEFYYIFTLMLTELVTRCFTLKNLQTSNLPSIKQFIGNIMISRLTLTRQYPNLRKSNLLTNKAMISHWKIRNSLILPVLFLIIPIDKYLNLSSQIF